MIHFHHVHPPPLPPHRSVAAAAAATLTLPDALCAQTPPSPTPVPYQLFTAQSLAEAAKTLQATPGNKNLVDAKQLPITLVMTTETAHSAKEFEWHEGRDHIVQILDGTTLYEVGGTPKNGRNTRPGEWLAPISEGATTHTLGKGDILLIPRGTPHKRTTTATVTLYLTSSVGTV